MIVADDARDTNALEKSSAAPRSTVEKGGMPSGQPSVPEHAVAKTEETPVAGGRRGFRAGDLGVGGKVVALIPLNATT